MTRAERRARTERIVARRERFMVIGDGADFGRARKHHPLACGHTDCWVCHSDKLNETPKPADRRQFYYEPDPELAFDE